MLIGGGRHRLRGQSFQVRPSIEPYRSTAVAVSGQRTKEEAFGFGAGTNGVLPANTTLRSFSKPTSVGLNVGLLPNDPRILTMTARECYDNDAILGAVVDTLSGIPFGNFSLSGIPKELLHPYLVSLDRVRSKTLMPVITTSHLVDGAFLGSGLFDEANKVWDAIVPHDMMHATITPVPFFGATPIVDVRVQQDALRSLRSGDRRMQRYLKFIPESMRQGGVIELEPENVFYIPRRTRGDVPLGTSIYRKVMILYLLEKALARGTIEMAYRRQRPMLLVTAGDENWDPSVSDLQELSNLLMAADLDPLGAVVVTRQGVQPQEVGGMGNMVSWMDHLDVLTSAKLKGMGMPDGLLGGDMALDSVSATLTVFIDMTRKLRDLITRLFFYEKFFPYISINNGHRKSEFKDFVETSSRSHDHFQSRASDTEVDMEDFITPTIQYHSTLRPEGDKDYLDMLMTMSQSFGVPIPIRMAAAAGGLDADDLVNSAPDDIELRTKIAKYRATVSGIDEAAGGQPGQEGQQGQGGGDEAGFEGGNIHNQISAIKHKGIINRKYDDRLKPRYQGNWKHGYTTKREQDRLEEKANRVIAHGAAMAAMRENYRASKLPKPQGLVLKMS